MPPKDADEMANSVDSDQKQSGLILHFVAQNCLFQYLDFTVKILDIGTCMSEQTV